jgi:hypothetical protein
MNEHIRNYAVGVLSLGMIGSFGLPAAAQMVIDDDDSYVVEQRYSIDRTPMLADPDDDDDADEVRVVYRDGMQRCAETFRSFDPTTGTYTSFQGETLVCPYLE